MKSFYKWTLIGVIFITLWFCSFKGEEIVCYVLPNDETMLVSSPATISIDNPNSADEWVVANFHTDLHWVADNYEEKHVRITLPAIQPIAEFATEFNAYIEKMGNDLIADIRNVANDSSYINISSVSYEASLNENLLSILLIEQFDTGEYNYKVYNFDVETGEELKTPDLCQRLLGLDYPSFLLASNRIIQRDFRDRYFKPLYGDTYEDVIDVLTDEEKNCAEAYYATLYSLPTDTFNLYNRSLYMDAEGREMLVFEGLLMSDEWWYELNTEGRIAPICLQEIDWKPVSKSSALTNLLTLPISGRRYYPEYYSYILQDAFLCSPKEYITVLSAFDRSQIEYAIDMLNYCMSEETKTIIVGTCGALIDNANITPLERTVVDCILATLE